jgi:ubiquinone/menaquinone biosynthesis C-methylase UbiE
MDHSFTTVTELPGQKASQEQFDRLYQRYHFAVQFSKDKEVLEVACGSGVGLGYLASVAKKVVGGDLDENIVKIALGHYKGRDKIEIKILDAENLPFEDKSFDVIILFEAIYYLPHPEKFLDEASRILKENGILIISTANKEWRGFNPSPFSTRYYSASELYDVLSQRFLKVDILGGFPASEKGSKNRIISLIRKAAVTLHLIPKTMKGKEKLKRIFLGKLKTLPKEIKEKDAEYLPPILISSLAPDLQYQVIFAVAKA